MENKKGSRVMGHGSKKKVMGQGSSGKKIGAGGKGTWKMKQRVLGN